MAQDLAYALRIFGKTPGFTATVIFTLALGIGANTAIFSIVEAVLLRPLPYRDANRLVVIWEVPAHDKTAPPVFDSYRDFEAWKRGSHTLDQLSVATWANGGRIFTGHGRAKGMLAMPVTIDFFKLLGVAPELGSTFQPDDLKRGCTIIVKHQFWQDDLDQERHVIGDHIQLDQDDCTIAGVIPNRFTFYPDVCKIWRLITPNDPLVRDPENANVGVFGRLRPGTSIEAAQQEIATLFREEHRNDSLGRERLPIVFPLKQEFTYLTGPNLRLSLIVLFAAVSFVLLIACVNVANLLLGRSLVRQKELAVRAALGSGRARLIRQLLTESLLLSCAGAALGFCIAATAVHYFRVANPVPFPPGARLNIDPGVLAFTAGLAIATALLFGLAPAWKASGVDLNDALQADTRSASLSRGAQQFGRVLIAAEIMLSLVLLVGAGLLIESVERYSSVQLGFSPDHVSQASMTLPKWNYSDPERRINFSQSLLNAADTLPEVEDAAFASSLPLVGGRFGAATLEIQGRPLNRSTAPRDIDSVSITGNYFRLMRVPLEQGRYFDTRDRLGSNSVAIVNTALVRKYFPHESPLGKHIRIGKENATWLTVVGVAGNEKDANFFHEMTWQAIPLVYRPIAQDPPYRLDLVVRFNRAPSALGPQLQKRIAAMDSSIPVSELRSLNADLSRILAYPRLRAVLIGIFAGFAMLLASIGLYGVIAQFAAQRNREVGIRMALGAQKRDVLALVLRQGIGLAIGGIVAGLTASWLLMRLIAVFLYGVKPADPWMLAGASIALLLIAGLSTYLPARRAANVDPARILRYE